MISWPVEVISALARRRAVVFLGAGVSRNATNAAGERPPTWLSFLNDGIEAIPDKKSEMKRLLRQGDLLSCCQIIKERLDHQWIPFLEEKFINPGYNSSRIHQAIFDLDATIVITPNFDKVYDNYATSTTGNNVRIKRYHDQDLGRFLKGTGSQRLILKIHGCIDTPVNLVFTRYDYAAVRNKHPSFYRMVDALIATYTFVFIGCSGSDPDIALMLEQYARSFQDSQPNYFVTHNIWSADYKNMMRKNYNLLPIPYSSRHEHAELTDSLVELATKVDEARGELAGSRLW